MKTGNQEIDDAIDLLWDEPTNGAIRRIERLVADLVAENETNKKNVVSGFYEEEVPQFRQGAPTHELESPVTADDCRHWIELIQKLQKEQK